MSREDGAHLGADGRLRPLFLDLDDGMAYPKRSDTAPLLCEVCAGPISFAEKFWWSEDEGAVHDRCQADGASADG